jgi:hypothetical protein
MSAYIDSSPTAYVIDSWIRAHRAGHNRGSRLAFVAKSVGGCGLWQIPRSAKNAPVAVELGHSLANGAKNGKKARRQEGFVMNTLPFAYRNVLNVR